MKYLGIDQNELKKNDALFTAKEISFQPELWKIILSLVETHQNEIKSFLSEAIANSKKIILTGAGTSAYIGLSLKGSFQRHLGMITESISTTDLVTHPKDYFSKDEGLLMVSFARSGNSPESVAATHLADNHCHKCFHLIITCDEHGELAKYEPKTKKLILLLPPESNDKSLAMTGSYSGMLLTGLLISNINNLTTSKNQVSVLYKYGNLILEKYVAPLQMIAQKSFIRGIFLGSGPILGTATESNLKLQELTDGDVICKSESYMGFRHGPKAVIDETSLVCYLISNEKYVQEYEFDLIKDMKRGRKPMVEIAVCEEISIAKKFDLLIKLSDDGKKLEEEFLTVCFILPAQILAFFKSLALGYKPDNPSISGSISRVVEGVKIYDDLNSSVKL